MGRSDFCGRVFLAAVYRYLMTQLGYQDALMENIMKLMGCRWAVGGLVLGLVGCFEGPTTVQIDCASSPEHRFCQDQVDADVMMGGLGGEAGGSAGGMGGIEGESPDGEIPDLGMADAALPDMGECADGAVRTCELALGNCTLGEQTCEGDAWGVCEPLGESPEVCNGADDDCDGEVDEGAPGAGAACETGLSGACASGQTVCEAGVLVCGLVEQPVDELCDGLDNDCDGEVDEVPTLVGPPIDTGWTAHEDYPDLRYDTLAGGFVALWHLNGQIYFSWSHDPSNLLEQGRPIVDGRLYQPSQATVAKLGEHLYILDDTNLHQIDYTGNVETIVLEGITRQSTTFPTNIITYGNELMVASDTHYQIGSFGLEWSESMALPGIFQADAPELFDGPGTLKVRHLIAAYKDDEVRRVVFEAAGVNNTAGQALVEYTLNEDDSIEARQRNTIPMIILPKQTHVSEEWTLVDGFMNFVGEVRNRPMLLKIDSEGMAFVDSGYEEHTQRGYTTVLHSKERHLSFISWGYSSNETPEDSWEEHTLTFVQPDGQTWVTPLPDSVLSNLGSFSSPYALEHEGIVQLIHREGLQTFFPGCNTHTQ
ncbi:MAG: MopE-related protein [Bradymonadia bacterium]